ncbi:intraflagellar transport 54 isoform X4 [Amblyomma americanum]
MMDEDVSARVIKKTQDLLGSVIKKPPLPEKLLKKPPFRFLHDVIHNVIKATKFLDGLYTQEELTSENIRDKEGKIAFLQKAIDAVGFVTGSALPVRPSKIVAGHEPDKTNEFLQTLAKYAAKKVDSTEAVQKVLAGEKPAASSKSDKKDGSKKKESSKASKKSEGERKSRKTASETEGNVDKKSAPKEKDKSSLSSKSSKTSKATSGEHRSKSREPIPSKAPEGVSQGDAAHQSSSTERPRTSSRKKSSRERKEPTDPALSELTYGMAKAERDPIPTKEDTTTQLDLHASNHNIQQEEEVEVKRPRSSKRSSRKEKTPDGRAEAQQERQPTLNTQETNSEEVNNLALPEPEGSAPGEVERPVSRSTLRSSRPRSSRPAAPRIRKRESSADSTPVARAPTAKPVENVILDTNDDRNEDDKDEEFVITEAPVVEPVLVKSDAPRSEQLVESEQGSLVKQILEAKKELEQGSQRSSIGFAPTEPCDRLYPGTTETELRRTRPAHW